MASVDLQDLLVYLEKLEDGYVNTHMKDNISALKILITAILPFLRHMLELYGEQEDFNLPLKNLDNEVRKMIRDFQGSELVSSHFSEYEDLELLSASMMVQFWVSNLVDLARKIRFLFLQAPRSVNWKKADIMLRIIQSLLKNLEDLSISTSNKFTPLKETKYVVKEIKFLRCFLRLMKNRCFGSDDAKSLFNMLENLAMELSTAFCFLILGGEQGYHVNTGGVLRDLLGNMESLQVVIKDFYDQPWESSQPDHDTPVIDKHILRFSDYLIERLRDLSDRNVHGTLDAKDQMNVLIEELSFLRYTVMDLLLQAPHEEMKSLITSTQALIIETGFFVYLFCDMEEGKEVHFSSDICNLLEAVDTVKGHADGLCGNLILWSRKCHCPLTNGLQFVDFLINTLERLMNTKEAPSYPLKHEIETLYKEIVPVRKSFSEITELGSSQMQFFSESLKDAAYLANYVIDSFEAREGSLWHQKLGLFVATKDVNTVQKELKTTLKKLYTHASSQAISHPTIRGALVSKDELQSDIEETTDKLVGFKDAEGEILELLTGGSKQLKIISIVGMPGLGKSTLANSVYKHPSVIDRFHVRAWCCISQVYEKESLLFEMSDRIIGRINQRDEIDGEDAILKLYQVLKGKRYLIVLDDIWDVKAWDDLKATFPDDDNGSRILFTTRHRVVASGTHSLIYALRLLSNKESCDLLWSKLFGSETCPQELLIISKHIARRCKGLPLAVVLMAGVLKRTERNKDSWEKVAKSFFGSNCGAHRKHLPKLEHSNVLESSYSHLPNHLKPCFLYVGAFPGNTAIPVSKLIRLWISEGLVQETNTAPTSVEQAAEDCLNELIDRSLVMIARRSSIGGVKACFIHDVIRDFCSEKLVEERSLMQENNVGGISTVYSGSKKHIRFLGYDHKSDRLLIFGNEEWQYIPPLSGNTPLRARKGLLSDRVLLRDRPIGRVVLTEGAAFGRGNDKSRQMDYHFIFKCKFLTVLDLANVRVENAADTYHLVKISELIQLRYLAVRVGTCEIPPQISNLQSLETFLIGGSIGEVIMPQTLWSLINLNHVLTDHSFFSFHHYSQEFFENFTQLDNLKSISHLYLSRGDDVEWFFMRRLTEIQKLGCRFSNSWDDSTGYNLFPVLQFLSKLESLKVFFPSKVLCPCKFSFPSQLKKLSMSNSRLPWDEISVIGRQLPNLKVLKLLNKAFEGKQWDMRNGEFQKLKFLKLDSLDIEVWTADAEHLPCLEQLLVLSCPQLEEIPSSFGEIPTLQLIEMKWCSSSAMDSVNQILEVQHDFCNNELKVNLGGAA